MDLEFVGLERWLDGSWDPSCRVRTRIEGVGRERERDGCAMGFICGIPKKRVMRRIDEDE